MKKKIFFSLAVFLLVFSVAGIVKASGNVTGWLWGGNDGTDGAGNVIGTTSLGWISMNSANCDADGNNFIDVNYCDLDNNTFVDAICGGDNTTDESASCGGDNITTPVVDYGVTIPAVAGNVSGYAWSENLGWVDFESQGRCVVGAPGAGQYQALSCTDPDGGSGGVSRNATDGLEGWARIISIAEASATNNSGGWEGWISMSGIVNNPPANDPYGVTIDDGDGTLCKTGDPTTDALGRCFAWSDELGWIDFSRASIVVPKTLKICEGDCNTGTLLPSTIAMFEGTSKSLSACYDTASDCSGGGDVTIAADWAETADPNDAIGLTDTDTSPEVLNANAVDADRTASFSVVHNTDTVNVTVNVNNIPVPACGNGIKDGAEECDDGAGNGDCSSFGVSCSDGTGGIPECNLCSTSSNWREVAP